MKKIFSVMSLLLVLSFSAYTQTLFLAKDGYSTADAQAKTAMGAGKYEFYLVGAYNGKLSSVTLSLDLSTGKGSAFIYLFRSTVPPDTTMAWAVTSVPFLGYVPIGIPAVTILALVPTKPVIGMTDTNWINSDVMGQAILNNSDYKTFIAANPTVKPKMAALGVNADPHYQVNTPLWVTAFDTIAGTSFVCAVNAKTRVTTCQDMAVKNGITDNQVYNKLHLFPNPANDFTLISTSPEIGLEQSSLEIFDSFGRKVNEFKIGTMSESRLYIPLDGYDSGMYFVKLHSGNSVYVNPLIITR